MPIVPRFNQQVQEQAAPGVRVQNVANEESFGGGQSTQALGQAFQQTADLGTKIMLAEKKKADDTATQEAWNKMVQAKNRLLYDPENGAITRKGKNALGIPEEFGQQFDKEADDIEKNLSTSQRQMFSQMRMKERSEFDTGLQKHMGTEIKTYELETRKSTLKTAQDEAVLNMHDPDKVAQSLSMVKAAGMEIANSQGWGPEQTKEFLDGEVSRTHASITARMLSNGDDRAAKSYFEANRDSIGADDMAKLEGALEEGSIRGESQRLSDTIARKHGSLGSAISEVKKIDDPKLRDATMERVKGEFALREAAKKDAEERDFLSLTNAIEGGKKYADLDPNIIARMPLNQRNALRAYAAGSGIETDPATYYDLKTMAAAPEMQDKFLKTNLLDYTKRLSPTDLKGMMDLQASIRNKDGKAEKELDGFLTNQEQVNNVLDQAEIKDKDKRARFLDKTNQVIREFSKANNRKPNADEVKKIADNLMIDVVTSKRAFWFDATKKAYELAPGDTVEDVETDKIPKSERRLIEDALRRNQRPVTDDTVKELYLRKLRATRAD